MRKQADFPSYAGVIEEYVDKTDSMDTSANEIIKPKSKRYLIDSMSIKTPKADMHVRPFLKDGLIDDWNLYENVLQYILGKHLKCDSSKHPILITEPVVRYLPYFLNFVKNQKNKYFIIFRPTINTSEKNCVKQYLKSFRRLVFIWLKMEFYQRLVFVFISLILMVNIFELFNFYLKVCK